MSAGLRLLQESDAISLLAAAIDPAQILQEFFMSLSSGPDQIITIPTVMEKLSAFLLDEDAGSREHISSFLHSLGMRIVTAESLEQISRLGPEAFEQIRLLAISTTMPGLTPHSLVQDILPLFPMVPVVLIGSEEEQDFPAGNSHIVGRLVRPLNKVPTNSALISGFEIASTLDELLRRHAYRKYPSYVEEPIARVIHDINNQMTGLKGGIDLLCYSIEMIREPATQAKFMRYIEQFIQPSLAQIEQLTSQWRRLRENRLRPLVTTNLVHILKRAILVAASPGEQRRIQLLVGGTPIPLRDPLPDAELREPVDNNDFFVKANPEQIGLALACVIQNALDAIAEGEGGAIIISISKHEDDRVSICIEDTGEGIGEAILPLIWRSFYTTKGEWRNGIGLCIAKQIIDKHQGQIEYLPGSRQGACFRILLHSASPGSSGSE